MAMSTKSSDHQVDEDLWRDFPEVPACQEEYFPQPEAILEGFEEFMALTPQVITGNFAAHDFEHMGSTEAGTCVHAERAQELSLQSTPQARQTATDRKQFKNRMSQKRFRARAKECLVIALSGVSQR